MPVNTCQLIACSIDIYAIIVNVEMCSLLLNLLNWNKICKLLKRLKKTCFNYYPSKVETGLSCGTFMYMCICYMTGKNPLSRLAQFAFINSYIIYLA